MTVTVTKMADRYRVKPIGLGEPVFSLFFVLTGVGLVQKLRFRLQLHPVHGAFPVGLKPVSAVLPDPAAVPAVAESRVLNYAAKREALYGPIREAGIFTWDVMYGEEYALASLKPISVALRQELLRASELLGEIFACTAEVVMQGDDELLAELGLPSVTWAAVRASPTELLPTLLGRFDFAATAEGIKMLEFNAETPTDVVEAFYVNGKVCEWFGAPNPNQGMNEQLQPMFLRATECYRQYGGLLGKIIFSSVDWHDEDAGTTRYLLAQSGLAGEFVALENLRVYKGRLQVWDGRQHTPIDLMYRLHPLEKLAEEQDADGYPTGCEVLKIVAEGKLSLINPPAAMLAQSKAMQALIWNLHEQGEFYSDEHQAAIAAYMLPTFFENRFSGACAYVTKPVYGREGGAVTVFGPDDAVWVRDGEVNYWEQPVVYQQYVELPQLTVETLNGSYCGRIIYGAFLVDGKGSGVVARVGSRITGNMAFYQPLCMSADASKGE